jgi:opacity protein-like surface antigen
MPSCRGVLKGLWPVAALLAGSTAVEQAYGDEPPQFSISPFVGYRVGGDFRLSDTGQLISLDDHAAFALAVDARADEGREYEFFYSRQSTALRGNGFAPVGTVVEYLHIGGTLALADEGWIRPYFGGGLGVTRLSPGLAPGTDDTRFSVSLALGLRAPLTQHFSLRLEARGYITPLNTDTALFCRSDQGGALCQVRVRGSALFQGDFLAGATYAF